MEFIFNLMMIQLKFFTIIVAGPAFDPELITGSLAQRIVSMVLAHGILYFHEIPHEPLVLANNMERIQNSLLPHRLGSIRPGHPFFNFNK